MSNADSDRKARIAVLIADFLDAERDGQPMNRAAWLSANNAYRLELAEFLSRHKPSPAKPTVSSDGATTYVIPGDAEESTAENPEQFETVDSSYDSPHVMRNATIGDQETGASQGTIDDGHDSQDSPDATMPGRTTGNSLSQTISDEVDGRTQVPDDCNATMAEAPADGTVAEGQIRVDDSRIKSTHFRQQLSAKATAKGEQPYNPPALDGDRYELSDFVARGGIGEVWRADDMRLGRSVALKSLRRGRETMRERFILEAELTGRLEHPGVVPVYDLALDRNDEPYYVMKFVRGRSMKDMVKAYFARLKNRKPTDGDVASEPNDSAELMLQRLLDSFVSLCETVGYAHERGIIHRDIKPENVMVGSFGETLVLDWGLAKDKSAPEEKLASLSDMHLSSAGTETRAGSVMGSPGYMAPELVEGEAHLADERTDIYLLGASLYEILTGKVPHHSGSLTGMLQRAREGTPDPPKDHNPNAPKVLCAICLKAMQKARDHRYNSAMELAQDVRGFLAGEPVSACPENLLERSLRWAKKNQKHISRSVLAAAVAAVLAFAWSLNTENQQLAAVQKAQVDVSQFQKLADEAQYFSATSDRLDDSTPYYDSATAARATDSALKISVNWGEQLEKLPLSEMRDSVRDTLHGLLLTTVQSRINIERGSDSKEKLRSLLQQARRLKGESASLLKLQEELADPTSGKKESPSDDGSDIRQAADPGDSESALDHFLRAEDLRQQASRSGSTDGDEWKAHADLLDRAIVDYRAAVRLRSGDFWSHFQMGRCYLSLGRYSESVETFGACVALRPDSPWSYSARGLALAMLKRFDEAITDLDRAIELDDEFLPAKLNRGVANLLAGKRESAENEFTSLLENSRHTPMPEAAYYRAVLRWEAGNPEAAIHDLETVLAARPKFPAAMLLQSRIYFLTGDIARGTRQLNLWLASNSSDIGSSAMEPSFEPDSWMTCFQRARFLRRLLASSIPDGVEPDRKGLLTHALDELQESIRQGGKSAELYSETGSVLELFGAAEEAFEAYSKSLEADPGNDLLLVKRGWLQALRLGKGDGAIADFEAALKVNPENAEAHSAHGFILALQNPSADAERAAVRAILHGAGDYLILHNVACIYAELAAASPDKAAAYERSALDILERGLQLWKKGNRTGPDAAQLARQEPSFRTLAKGEAFQTLLELNAK
jgi:serine/threonine protein kinase/Flp pilus assembly protein TadD